MIRITIEGPQGSGKTRLARIIKSVLDAMEKTTNTFDEGVVQDIGVLYKRQDPDVELECKTADPRPRKCRPRRYV